jgi:hypothetical protein
MNNLFTLPGLGNPAEIQPPDGHSPLSVLPEELLLQVLRSTREDPRSYLFLQRTSKLMLRLTRDHMEEIAVTVHVT